MHPLLKANLRMGEGIDPEKQAINEKKLSDRFTMLRNVVNNKTILTLRDEV